jgi:hypothetical protein
VERQASERSAILWARMPPPPGGVTRANAALRDAMATYCRVTVMDGGRNGPLRTLRALTLRRPGLVQVFSMSEPHRILTMAPFLLSSRRRSIVVIHGAAGVDRLMAGRTLRNRLTVRTLRVAGQVWVNNAVVAAHLRTVGIRAEIVSPSPHGEPPAKRHSKAVGFRLLAADGNNNPLYNADLVVEAAERLRSSGLDVEVMLLTYGPGAAQRVLPAFARQALNLDEDGVNAALRWANVLVRPTTTDGDSLLVREALGAGIRVVASDCVPRPRGVEVFTLGQDDLGDVLAAGGRMSAGDGFGRPLDEALSRFFSNS